MSRRKAVIAELLRALLAPVSDGAASAGTAATAKAAEPAASELVEIATYFRESMDKRRAIELRAFLATVTFDLLLVRGSIDLKSHLNNLDHFRWTVRGVAVIAWLLLAGMVLQIELVNCKDRRYYRCAEARLAARVLGEKPRKKPHWLFRKEGLLLAVLGSWAGTWTVVAAAMLTGAVWYTVGLLSPT